MEFQPKNVRLKNGTTCILRSPGTDDAADILEYLKQTAEETLNMMRYPDEIDLEPEEIATEKQFLTDNLKNPRNMMISAFADGELLGNVSISCPNNRFKFSHRGNLGIALKKRAWGIGLGTILMQEILIEAKKMDYEIVELGVVESNERGLALYRKIGFLPCGRVPKGVRFRDGSYQDEIFMYIDIADRQAQNG